ncbi:MAG: iron transporter [Streptosporangiales bacterium]|nr:iron transporter [Streptosporangiales bacterium]
MFANYLIGLREGLEAALVISILIAYLVKTGRRSALPPVWLGVGGAVALSAAFGVGLSFTPVDTFKAQETMGGVLSIVAVGLVTWMVFWMRRAARFMKAELEGRMDQALDVGPLAVGVVGFISVGREGLETALFLWSGIRAAGETAAPIAGALAGLATAVVLGYLIYRGGLRLNLKRFFTWTGAALIVVAAGVLAYGMHDLQEAELLPGLQNKAFDLSEAVPTEGALGWLASAALTLLKAVFNFQLDPTWLQAVVWVAYLVPVMVLFLRPHRSPLPGSAAAPEGSKAR